MMGTVNVGKLVVTVDSFQLDQLIDVDALAPDHNAALMYNDNATDAGFTDGWHAKPLLVENMGNVNSDTVPTHNEILVYNDFATDAAYPDGWVNKDITAVFTNLEAIVQSISNVKNSTIVANSGNISKTDQIMLSETVAATGVVNVSISSCGDNNGIYKKEIVDTDFVFIQNLDLGQIVNLTYTTGTVFRSDKGISGFSGPFAVPLCPASFSIKEARFYCTETSGIVPVVSMGTDVVVTLYQSDGVTVEDGPTAVIAYETINMSITATGEYFISSTGNIACGIIEGANLNMRPIVPMSTELIGYNRNCFITAQETGTTVTFHRRNNLTGTIAVSEGTSVDATLTTDFGSTADLNVNGGMILRSDSPISARFRNDSSGNQAVGYWPTSQLGQLFPIAATIDTDVDYGVACIAVVSKYAGSYSVYDSTGTFITTSTITRNGVLTPATSAADQLYPATGRWNPAEALGVSVTGGYITSDVPCLCIMNFNGSAVWTDDVGDEIAITGSTPVDIKAEIRLDAGGLARRRDVDAAGAVTWNIC